MLRIQAVLDECGSFPENSTANILNIINMIPDKSTVAWKERLEGRSEIDNCKTKIDSKRKSDQGRRKETRSERYLSNTEVC